MTIEIEGGVETTEEQAEDTTETQVIPGVSEGDPTTGEDQTIGEEQMTGGVKEETQGPGATGGMTTMGGMRGAETMIEMIGGKAKNMITEVAGERSRRKSGMHQETKVKGSFPLLSSIFFASYFFYFFLFCFLSFYLLFYTTPPFASHTKNRAGAKNEDPRRVAKIPRRTKQPAHPILQRRVPRRKTKLKKVKEEAKRQSKKKWMKATIALIRYTFTAPILHCSPVILNFILEESETIIRSLLPPEGLK